jgi:conjugative transfer signal peptidase TraF
MATSGLLGRLRNTSPRTAKLIGATALSTCLGTSLLMGMLGVRINASPSLPLGLYVETSDQSGFVEFCPAEPFGSFAAVRGYRSKGNCPDGASPLMKPVIAWAGDLVETSSRGIAVNGVLVRNTAPRWLDTFGRTMTPWPFGAYNVAPGTVWVASSYNAKSFDSRYFGPVAVSSIRAHLRPLLVEP